MLACLLTVRGETYENGFEFDYIPGNGFNFAGSPGIRHQIYLKKITEAWSIGMGVTREFLFEILHCCR